MADLSRFEKGNHQPEGVYRVDIWRNDEFVATQDIRFTTSAGKAGEKSGGLMPCFGARLGEAPWRQYRRVSGTQ